MDVDALPEAGLVEGIIGVESDNIGLAVGLEHEARADHCFIVVRQKWAGDDGLDPGGGEIRLVRLIVGEAFVDGAVMIEAVNDEMHGFNSFKRMDLGILG
jgi:hypothetical protein